jgi:S-(hydroxymethyl)glutathione dehydrogenase/alcohol dehydrogenase
VVVGVWTVQGWGKTVVLGVDGSAAPISVPSFDIMRGRSVTGSLFGGIKPKDDIPVLAQKYLDKVICHRQSDAAGSVS